MSFDVKSVRPRGTRMVISRPQPVGLGEVKINGIYLPDKNHRDRQYGLIGTVVSVGSEVDPDISPGAQVIIGEFAGVPIFDGVQETPYWLVGQGEVMAYVG